MSKDISTEQIDAIALVLKTISHPMRIAIIVLLHQRDELSVSEIASQLSLEQSLTSHHLANMKMAGVLGSKRVGKHIFYFLKMKELPEVLTQIGAMELPVPKGSR